MRITRCCLKPAAQMIDYYSQYHPSVLSIQQFIDFGTKKPCERTSYLFLRKELLVRLANIMKEINLLPDQLLSMPSVKVVEGWYEQSFEDIQQFQKGSSENRNTLKNFTETLVLVRNRHTRVVETMAQGVIEMRESSLEGVDTLGMDQQLQYFLDRFYMNRISIRMLINQHTLLFATTTPSPSHHRHIGSIDPFCDILSVAEDAFENAQFLCDQYYLTSPNVQFTCHNAIELVDRISFTYVPSHLYHILFELFKNAMRAVVEYHGENCDQLPKLKVMIAKGAEDVTVKISDEGGGIKRSVIDLLFNYMYSTAPRPPSPAAASSAPLAGYGYGLPLSRLYAKYFNGDLQLQSIEGWGTDATLYLKVFPKDASELLPVYNRTSSQRYSRSIPVADWSDPSQTVGLHGAVHQIGQHRQYSTRSSKVLKKVNNVRRFGTYVITPEAMFQLQKNEGKHSLLEKLEQPDTKET